MAPLIVSSRVQAIRGAGLATPGSPPDRATPTRGTLTQAVMALDVRSKSVTGGGGRVVAEARIPKQVVLGWLGSSVALYADADPFRAELATASGQQDFLYKHADRLPQGVHFEVSDGARLALFLAGFRAFVDQAAPGLAVRETHEHRGRRYVRLAEAGDGGILVPLPELALHYHASPRSLTLSL